MNWKDNFVGINLILKEGVEWPPNAHPFLAFWMYRVNEIWNQYTGAPQVITQIYANYHAHTTQAWDTRRPQPPLLYHHMEPEFAANFCTEVQGQYGKFVGVQLEPEWGMGDGYTAPHIHFQLKAV